MRLTQRFGNGSCRTKSRRCCSAERRRVVTDGSLFICRLLPRNRAWCRLVPQPSFTREVGGAIAAVQSRSRRAPSDTRASGVRLQVRQSSALSYLTLTKSVCVRFRTKRNSDGKELVGGTNGSLWRLSDHV